MKIDPFADDIVKLSEAPGILPRGAKGRKVHVSTIWRWSSRGIRGIKLATVRVGGMIFTSREALRNFFDQLNNSETLELDKPVRRRRRATRVKQRLKDKGLLS